MNDHDEIILRYEQARGHLAQVWIELENNRIAQARLNDAWQAVRELEQDNLQVGNGVPARNLLRQGVTLAWAWILKNVIWPSATRYIPASPPDALREAFVPLEDWRPLESLANALSVLIQARLNPLRHLVLESPRPIELSRFDWVTTITPRISFTTAGQEPRAYKMLLDIRPCYFLQCSKELIR